MRLGGSGEVTETIRLPKPPAPLQPERLEGETNWEAFDGKSVEPDVEAMLEGPRPEEVQEGSWGASARDSRGVPYGWFVLLGLVLAGGAVWAAINLHKGEKETTVVTQAVREKVTEEEKEEKEAAQLVDRVEKVVAKFLAATSIAEALPYVRQPERVKPLMEDWYGRHPWETQALSKLGMIQPAVLEGRSFWVVGAVLKNGQRQSLLVEELPGGDVKVDWEILVCYQPMEWDRYLADRPSNRAYDFRVWATQDTLYSHEFADSTRWICYRLTVRGSDEYLYGYVPVGSPEAKAMAEMAAVTRATGRASATLRLRVPAGANSARGVVIESVVARRWTYLDADRKDSP